MSIDTSRRPGRQKVKRERSPGEPEQGSSPPPGAAASPPPRMPGRRNPKWIALGVTALCLGGLLSYFMYGRLAHATSMVVLTTTVHRGETLQASDLGTITMSGGTELHAVPASELRQLVGQQAVYDLVEGSLLPVGSVAHAVVPRTGRAVVGVRLVSGRAPTGVLTPGSPLRLVALPPSGADPGYKDQYSGRSISARQISQSDGADGTSIVINVDVAANDAPMVALLAAQERLAAVRDADR